MHDSRAGFAMCDFCVTKTKGTLDTDSKVFYYRIKDLGGDTDKAYDRGKQKRSRTFSRLRVSYASGGRVKRRIPIYFECFSVWRYVSLLV